MEALIAKNFLLKISFVVLSFSFETGDFLIYLLIFLMAYWSFKSVLLNLLDFEWFS
jgi:hypothetical protein